MESNNEKLKRKREIKARFIANQKAKGLCIECSNAVSNGRLRCDECLARRSKKRTENKAKAIENNLCRECFVIPSFGQSRMCKKCFAKKISRRYFKTSAHWQELLDKFEAQSGICAYSGRPLKLSEDTELDHIVPRSRGGANEVSNVHWVLTSVNRMKRNLLESEFFALINDIRETRNL